MPGDSTTSPPPGPEEDVDFSDLLDDDEPAEEVTATGIATASVAAAAAQMALGATTTEERPTLVPAIDLQALAKLGPEAFAHRQGLPADLLALSASLGSAGKSTAPTQAQAHPAAQQNPERARSEMPSPIPTPLAMPAVVVPPAPALDMFELDPVSLAFDEDLRRSRPPDSVPEEERPTSRPPIGLGPASMRPVASVARAQTVDDFFNDLDDPSEMHPMTEPPGEGSPTDIPPHDASASARARAMGGHFDEHAHPDLTGSDRSVDDMFADMIDEPFPPSFVPAAPAAASLVRLDSLDAPMDDADETAPHPTLSALTAVPIDEISSDEIFDADADEAMADLRARFAANDFPGALHLAEPLANDMLHAAEVAEIIAACQAAMQARYVERIGSLTKIPVISVPMSVILDLPIDNRAGFLLSRIDGVSSLEMILDMCGMNELDALRIVYDLVQNGALEFI